MIAASARQFAFVVLALTLGMVCAGPIGSAASRQSPLTLPTASTPQGARTGVIVGQVVDGTTGDPIANALVRLTMPRVAPEQPGTPRDRVMTDDEGRFFFTDLPAGEYWLGASREGYVAGEYGQRRASSSGELLPLAEHQRRLDVTLRVWKYAVIGGTVVDEAGERVVGVAVRALVKEIVAGRAQFGTQSYVVPTGTTDDRGRFRLARVPPGTYAVVVPSVHTTLPLSVMNTWDSATMRTELFWAGMYEVAPLGHPRTQQIGDHVLMSLNTVLIPPPPDAGGRMRMYRTTFYPSATSAPAGTAITVGAGDERTDLAIAMAPAPAVRVSGRLVTPDGSAPPPMGLKLIGDASTDVTMASRPSSAAEVGLEPAIGVSDSAGRFTLLGVAPGEYTLTHADSFLSRAVQQGRQPYWVRQRLTVGTDDLRDVVVNLRPALRVEGRIELRGTAGPPPLPTMVFERPSGEPDQFAAEGRTGAFATVAAGGRYIARAVESGGWFVDSITLDGKDITDQPFDLDTDATTFVVTYTDRACRVSGSVKNDRGVASATAMVLAFPTDPQRWLGYGKSSRALKSVAASPAGSYAIAHLPPGDYYVVAIDEDQADGWRHPDVLRTLANQAERIRVSSGDQARTLDLTVRRVR